ncbi:MAG: protein kinase [Synechococcales cyanobacterium RM1_1_8]|nr:protein kinase [Synechococcales cyanobacterium RM1_1_8]
MATSTATVLIPGTVVNQRYVIQELRQFHHYYHRYLALGPAESLYSMTEFPLWAETSPACESHIKQAFEQRIAPLMALRHPQLPRFTAAFRDRNSYFLIQEPSRGISYRKLLQRRAKQSKTLTEPEVIHLLTHLLPALQDLHSQKLIHSKLSPDSILLPISLPTSSEALCAALRREIPLLVELGQVDSLARQLHAIQAQRPMTDLAPTARLGYAPPEQMQTGRIYPHSDLYSLAVTCLELLTGQAPQKLLDSHTLTWSWQAYTKLGDPFEEILSRMLSWQPGDRFATAQQVLQAIQAMPSQGDHGFRLGSFSLGPAPSRGQRQTQAQAQNQHRDQPKTQPTNQTTTGSILSLQSWPLDAFRSRRRPKRPLSPALPLLPSSPERLRQNLAQNALANRQGAAKRSATKLSVTKLSVTKLSVTNRPASQFSPPARAPRWQFWGGLVVLGGAMVATALVGDPMGRSPWSGILPQAGGPWSWVERLNPSRNQAESGPESGPVSQPETPPSGETGPGERAIADLPNGDIPIPIYLSATHPEQSIQGSLRVLPSQSYFVIGQPGQRLTAQLNADSAQLTVLDSELRPRMAEWRDGQWQGLLETGERTLLRIEGSGQYRLELSVAD